MAPETIPPFRPDHNRKDPGILVTYQHQVSRYCKSPDYQIFYYFHNLVIPYISITLTSININQGISDHQKKSRIKKKLDGVSPVDNKPSTVFEEQPRLNRLGSKLKTSDALMNHNIFRNTKRFPCLKTKSLRKICNSGYFLYLRGSVFGTYIK